MKVILALLLVTSYASAQYATTYSAAQHNYTPYIAPTVVKKTVIHQDIVYTRYIAAIPLLDLPTYSAYYTPAPVAAPAAAPIAAPAAQPCGDMAKVLKLLEGMDARLNALEKAPAPKTFAPVPPAAAPASPPAKVDLRQSNQQKCALCHAAGNEKKGGDFILSDATGAIVRMTDGQLADLQIHVVKGSMPKLNAASRAAGITALTIDEAEAWIEEAKRQRAANRASTK